MTEDHLMSPSNQYDIIRAVSIINSTAADIVMEGLFPRTERLTKPKKIMFYSEKKNLTT